MTLDEYLDAEDETATAFAARTGLSIVSISRYRRGHRLPEEDAMNVIIAATAGRVTPNDFYGVSPVRRRPKNTPKQAS